MTKFLRPEFVTTHWTSLNPDAFSRFHSRLDPHFDQHRASLQQAHRILLEKIVELRLGLINSRFEGAVTEPTQVAVFLHRQGVNLRYLGRLLSTADTPLTSVSKSLQVIDIFLIEAVARSLKCRAKDQMRQLSSNASASIRESVLTTLGQIRTDGPSFFVEVVGAKFGPTTAAQMPLHRIANVYSRQLVLERFCDLIGYDERTDSFHIRTMRVSVVSRVDTIDSLQAEVELRETTFGRFHEKVGTAKLRLADLISKAGRHEEANALYRDCLCIFEICSVNTESEQEQEELGADLEANLEDTLDTHVPELLASNLTGIGNLCNALQSYGEHLFRRRQIDEGIHQLRRCVMLRERIASSTAEVIALGQDLHLLGWMCKSAGHYADAELILSRAIAVQEKCTRHPLGGTSYIELARNYLSMARRVHLIDSLQKQAYRITVGLYGEDHSQIAIIFNNRAILLLWQGYLSEAAHLAQRAYDIRVFRLGPNNVYCAHSVLLLAQVHIMAGNFADAETTTATAQEIYRLNNATWLRCAAFAVLARLRLQQQRYQEALQAIDQSLVDSPDVFPIFTAAMRVERAAIQLGMAQSGDAFSEHLALARQDFERGSAVLTSSSNPHHFLTALKLGQCLSDITGPQCPTLREFLQRSHKIIVSELILWGNPPPASAPPLANRELVSSSHSGDQLPS